MVSPAQNAANNHGQQKCRPHHSLSGSESVTDSISALPTPSLSQTAEQGTGPYVLDHGLDPFATQLTYDMDLYLENDILMQLSGSNNTDNFIYQPSSVAEGNQTTLVEKNVVPTSVTPISETVTTTDMTVTPASMDESPGSKTSDTNEDLNPTASNNSHPVPTVQPTVPDIPSWDFNRTNPPTFDSINKMKYERPYYIHVRLFSRATSAPSTNTSSPDVVTDATTAGSEQCLVFSDTYDPNIKSNGIAMSWAENIFNNVIVRTYGDDRENPATVKQLNAAKQLGNFLNKPLADFQMKCHVLELVYACCVLHEKGIPEEIYRSWVKKHKPGARENRCTIDTSLRFNDRMAAIARVVKTDKRICNNIAAGAPQKLIEIAWNPVGQQMKKDQWSKSNDIRDDNKKQKAQQLSEYVAKENVARMEKERSQVKTAEGSMNVAATVSETVNAGPAPVTYDAGASSGVNRAILAHMTANPANVGLSNGSRTQATATVSMRPEPVATNSYPLHADEFDAGLAYGSGAAWSVHPGPMAFPGRGGSNTGVGFTAPSTMGHLSAPSTPRNTASRAFGQSFNSSLLSHTAPSMFGHSSAPFTASDTIQGTFGQPFNPAMPSNIASSASRRSLVPAFNQGNAASIDSGYSYAPLSVPSNTAGVWKMPSNATNATAPRGKKRKTAPSSGPGH